MLFVSGGILETYRAGPPPHAGEFFAASGAFFWRFVRLALLSIVPFVIVGMIYQGTFQGGGLDRRSCHRRSGGNLSGLRRRFIFLLLALWVRLWFDIAKVRAVVMNERGMWRNTWRAWRMTWRSLRHLYRVYFCISLVAWVTLLGLVIWAHLRHRRYRLTFIVLELIVFAQLHDSAVATVECNYVVSAASGAGTRAISGLQCCGGSRALYDGARSASAPERSGTGVATGGRVEALSDTRTADTSSGSTIPTSAKTALVGEPWFSPPQDDNSTRRSLQLSF